MQTLLSPNRTIIPVSKPREIDVIVLHDMEAPEGPLTAENVAKYFQNPAVKASAHFNVDNDSIVRSVPDKDVAWAAPGCNHNGLQIEIAGYARQTPAEWADAYSKSALALAAKLTAQLCKQHDIPPRYISKSGLLAGMKGITTHADVSLAFKKSNHTDPGANFPMAGFIQAVQTEHKKLIAPPSTSKVVFQVVNNGKLIFESLPAERVGAPSERLRLASFLSNHIRGIHAQLAADPDASLQIKLVRKVEV